MFAGMRKDRRTWGSLKERCCPVAWKLGLKGDVRVGVIPSHDGAVVIAGKEAPVVRDENEVKISAERVDGAKQLPLGQAPLPTLVILAECCEKVAVSCNQKIRNF